MVQIQSGQYLYIYIIYTFGIVDVVDLYQPQSIQVCGNRFGHDILSFVIPTPRSLTARWLEDDLCLLGPGNFSGSMLVFWGVRLLSVRLDTMPCCSSSSTIFMCWGLPKECQNMKIVGK